MGQAISNSFEDLKDDVVKEAHVMKEVIDISHEEFLEKVKELNEICKKSESDGRKLRFFIKKGSDATFVWKQTVRIACKRVSITDASSAYDCNETIDEEIYKDILMTTDDEAENYKLLSLRQFLVAQKMIAYHYSCIQQSDLSCAQLENAAYTPAPHLSTSLIFDKIMKETESDSEECIICMERKPEVTLPCAHSYCLFCIEQWNVSNKTCPVCRTAMENTDDTWVTPEIPESSEVNAEIEKALKLLTIKLPQK